MRNCRRCFLAFGMYRKSLLVLITCLSEACWSQNDPDEVTFRSSRGPGLSSHTSFSHVGSAIPLPFCWKSLWISSPSIRDRDRDRNREFLALMTKKSPEIYPWQSTAWGVYTRASFIKKRAYMYRGVGLYLPTRLGVGMILKRPLLDRPEELCLIVNS